MVEAVRDWIEGSIKAGSQGHAKFEAVVAMNALGIVLRDLGACVRAEDRDLAAALLRGERTLAEPGLLAKLRRDVLDKCEVDTPNYATLDPAQADWGGQGIQISSFCSCQACLYTVFSSHLPRQH